MKTEPEQFFQSKLNDVEHALILYARSFMHMPALGIYDEGIRRQNAELLSKCHIYLLGYLPKIDLKNIRQDKQSLIVTLSTLGKTYDVVRGLPKGFYLHEENGWYLSDINGKKHSLDSSQIMAFLSEETEDIVFHVKYIGQAYGQQGERNAIDRLLRHETLQMISLKGVPEGYSLEIMMLEITPANKTLTVFNPFAKNKEKGNERISNGLAKLFNTNEQEQVALYEASLIRYFQPEFNKEFKDSFPSTNLKVLKDCYDKDFSAVIAEINFDNMPYRIGSEKITPAYTHEASHDLHESEERRIFFSDL